MKTDIKLIKKNSIPLLLFFLLMMLYLEVMLHLFVYHSLSSRIVYPIIFALAAGAFIYALCSLPWKKYNYIAAIVLTGIIVLYFEIQFVYNSIFGEFMALWQISFGTTAITNFYKQMIYGILRVLPQIIVLLLPIPAIILLKKFKVIAFKKCSLIIPACGIAAALLFHFGCVGIMYLNNGAFSVYEQYISDDTVTEVSIKNVGLLATSRLEAVQILFGKSNTGGNLSYAYNPDEPGKIGEYIFDETKNQLNIDFSKLYSSAEDEKLKALDLYFSNQPSTSKNEYTGIFSDYNLITICAESYSPMFISKELTPALYEMTTNGFVFNNYYGTYASNTTNGEYTFCTGLFPDFSRGKSAASFYASQNNYLPFCLGNLFSEKGVKSWAYHNYLGGYYCRDVTHPNMGYTFKSADNGLDMEIMWPSSDLEMFQNSVDDYISQEQFCAYYMTFSGHYQYNWENNMSAKNRTAVDALDCSDTVKAYIACNLELEYALEYLTDRLESAGIADKTVIILTNDHYPYGLSDSQYNELAGREIDTVFEKYKNSFICYTPGMCVPVDTYCSTVDILPTVLNLFGFEYDSRLLAGKDVLSPEAENLAILSDQSFITESFGFDASSGDIVLRNGSTAPDSTEVKRLQTLVSAKFSVSTDVLNSNYYAHAILGKADSDSGFDAYTFTDMPETFDFRVFAMNFLYDGGYVDAESNTVFGFESLCTYQQFFDVLYRLEGCPEISSESEDALSRASAWANENGLIYPTEKEYAERTLISRPDAAYAIYKYAILNGMEINITDEETAELQGKYPDIPNEELKALLWCNRTEIMIGSDGTLQSVMDMIDAPLKKAYMMAIIYNYHTYASQK